MTRSVITIILICTLSRMCPAQGTNDTPKPLPTDYSNLDFDSLADDKARVVWRFLASTNTQQAFPTGRFDFEVTRSYSHPPAARPGDGLDDKLYAANTNGIQYKVEFSSDGKTVNINTPKSLIGTLSSDSGNVRTYAVSSFAGGRFVVSATGTNCEAELTIYGSGVPIISSVRGYLVRSKGE